MTTMTPSASSRLNPAALVSAAGGQVGLATRGVANTPYLAQSRQGRTL